MRTLIITDVHANLPAFESVLTHAKKWDRVMFLGDIAIFGPHPAECVDLLRELSPICVMGNHDYSIAGAWGKRNFFDQWSRERLRDSQLKWIGSFEDSVRIDEDTLLIHGAYDVSYDILPGIPDDMIVDAFCRNLDSGISKVFFGHYHYQVDRRIRKTEYHCIRPVGHHRDKDSRAGFSILENGELSHYRVPYDLEKTIYDTRKIECLTEPLKTEWLNLLKEAYSDSLLKGDLQTMQTYGGVVSAESKEGSARAEKNIRDH